MKILKLLIFILVILTVNSTLINQLYASKLPTIILNTAAEAPLSTPTQDGFLDKLATKIFNKIGYQLIVEKLPAERALRRVNKGLIDGEIIRVAGMNKYYPNLIQVPEPMVNVSFVVFSKKYINLQSGWSALAHKELAYIIGWKIYEMKVPDTAVVTNTKDSYELFSLLKKERVDFVLYNRWAGYHIINKLKLKNIHLQTPALAEKEMFMYLHKKYLSLVPKVAAILAKMKKDGEYKRLMDTYLLPIKKYKP